MVTGASSGIGEATALQIGRAGGHVLLVARSEPKLSDIAARIVEHGGAASVHTADLSSEEDLARMSCRGARAPRGRRHPRQQRRALDPALDQVLLRPPARLPADDGPQLPGAGAARARLPAGDARARLRARRQRLLRRGPDQDPALRRLHGLEGGARRLQRVRGGRARAQGHPLHHGLDAARADADDRALAALRELPLAEPRAGGRPRLQGESSCGRAGSARPTSTSSARSRRSIRSRWSRSATAATGCFPNRTPARRTASTTHREQRSRARAGATPARPNP